MTEKTLGQVAYEAIGPPTAVADAVIAEYEARRWRAWDTAPQDIGDDKRFLAYNISDKNTYVIWRTYEGWTDGEIDEDGCYACWPLDTRCFTHWTPIPAPPQEADHGA